MFQHIYIGDSEKVLKKQEGGSVSLVVTSPPYYVMRGYQPWKDYDEYLDKMYRIFRECKRVLHHGRYCVVNVCDYRYKGRKYAIPSDFIQFMVKALNFHYIDDIIWVKPCGSSSSGAGSRCGNFVKTGFPLYYYPNNRYEHLLIFRKGSMNYKVIYNKKKYALDYTKFKKYLSDVWRFSTVVHSKDHPAKFPELLPYLVINFYSLPIDSEVVLDPFLGSGTTMKVARELGRSSIGIELDDTYLPAIKEKVGYEQTRLTTKIVDKYITPTKLSGQLNILSATKQPEAPTLGATMVEPESVDWQVLR